MTELGPSSILDHRFEIGEELGQGGMGVVFRARHLSLARDVAIKVMRSALLGSPEKLARFRREARLISSLDHPNIVEVFAAGVTSEGQPYIAMELLNGRQVSDIIRENGSLPWKTVLAYSVQLCDALQYAHENQIIHRDIKPSNIVVGTVNTVENQVKLVDFGIAKSLTEAGPALTQTEMIIGSVFYLSPGQFQGRAADPRSDIYSLGCSLFEMLAGVPPFSGDTVFDTIQKHTTDPLPKVNEVNPSASIPEDLQLLLEWMTAKDNNDRPLSAKIVRDNIVKIQTGEGIAPEIKPQLPTRKKRKAIARAKAQAQVRANRRLAILLATIGILLISGAAFIFSGKQTLFQTTAMKPAVQPVYITSDPREPPLVDTLNSVDPTSTNGKRHAELYADLATVYRERNQPAASTRLAYTAFSVLHLPYRPIDSQTTGLLRIIGLNKMDIGQEKQAADLLKQVALFQERTRNSPADTRVYEIDALNRLPDYAGAVKLLNRFHGDFSLNDDIRQDVLFNGFFCQYRAGNFREAARYLSMLKEGASLQKEGLLPGQVLWFEVLQGLSDQSLRKAPTAHAVEALTAKIQALPERTLYRAECWVLAAELQLRCGHADEALNMIEHAWPIYSESATDGTTAIWKLSCATHIRNHLRAIAPLLPHAKRTQFEMTVGKFDTEIGKRKTELMSGWRDKMPVHTVETQP